MFGAGIGLRSQTLFPTELRAHCIDTKIFALRAHVALVNVGLLRWHARFCCTIYWVAISPRDDYG